MNAKDFQKDLSEIVNKHSLDKTFNLPNCAIEEYIMDSLNSLMKVNRLKPQSDEVDDFIDRMYAIYPPRCPKRNASLGKTRKDKERIRKLLKTYSMEEIEKVFKHEIEEKYEKQYMQNFSTFLNNFPDPSALDSGNLFGVSITEEPNSYKKFNGSINIDGQIYR
jgi:hypothetical protein